MNFLTRSSRAGRFAFALILWPLSLLASDLAHKNQPVRSPDVPVLIWDIDLKLANDPPRNWRTTDDPLKPGTSEAAPSILGLHDLQASGSGEFTPEGLKLVLTRTRGPVTVFDLRQETHIFVNDLPVSWYASRDWANVGRTQTDIEANETARVASLKPGSKIDVRPGHPVKHGNPNSVSPQQVTIERASIERDVVQSAGGNYVRVTVTDHTRPFDDEVDRFIFAVRALPENGWAHFHCEAGLGRTTTFMVLYDMLRNASRVSLEDIAKKS
jgi:protein-tyrosine phosphatase